MQRIKNFCEQISLNFLSLSLLFGCVHYNVLQAAKPKKIAAKAILKNVKKGAKNSPMSGLAEMISKFQGAVVILLPNGGPEEGSLTGLPMPSGSVSAKKVGATISGAPSKSKKMPFRPIVAIAKSLQAVNYMVKKTAGGMAFSAGKKAAKVIVPIVVIIVLIRLLIGNDFVSRGFRGAGKYAFRKLIGNPLKSFAKKYIFDPLKEVAEAVKKNKVVVKVVDGAGQVHDVVAGKEDFALGGMAEAADLPEEWYDEMLKNHQEEEYKKKREKIIEEMRKQRIKKEEEEERKKIAENELKKMNQCEWLSSNKTSGESKKDLLKKEKALSTPKENCLIPVLPQTETVAENINPFIVDPSSIWNQNDGVDLQINEDGKNIKKDQGKKGLFSRFAAGNFGVWPFSAGEKKEKKLKVE